MLTSERNGDYPLALIIGYGNCSRKDDGVGAVIANQLRERLGKSLEDPNSDGLDDLGDSDSPHIICVHQLAPEFTELVAQHDMVIFLDAHLGEIYPEPLRVATIEPKHSVNFASHIISPSMMLAMAQHLYGKQPKAYLVSVRGYDFDFGEELSPETAAIVDKAVAAVLDLISK